MRILIIFGTTEGHTREISQFMAKTLRELGHTATVEEATDGARAFQIDPYDAILLAASLHVGRYQPVLVRFAQARAAELNGRRTAFVSVSLSAAGESPEDWAGLTECVAQFEHETGWRPGAVHHVAGAIRYSQYDFFKRLAIRHIAARRGQKTVTSRDYDLTDYDELRTWLLDFVSHDDPQSPLARAHADEAAQRHDGGGEASGDTGAG